MLSPAKASLRLVWVLEPLSSVIERSPWCCRAPCAAAVQLYVVPGNGERRSLHELGEGAGIELDVGVLDLAARGAHEVIVAVDGVVIAQGLTLTEPQFGHLPGLDEQCERPIDRRRSDALDSFAYAVSDLVRCRVAV